MKTTQAIKVVSLSVAALGAGYTLGYLDGSGISDVWSIAGRIALGIIIVLILAVLAKLIVAALIRWKGGRPPNDGGKGPQPRVPRPGGGRPPVLSAAADLRVGSNA